MKSIAILSFNNDSVETRVFQTEQNFRIFETTKGFVATKDNDTLIISEGKVIKRTGENNELINNLFTNSCSEGSINDFILFVVNNCNESQLRLVLLTLEIKQIEHTSVLY